MSNDQEKLREVAWTEIFPWLCLVRVFRLAIDSRKLFLSALGLALTGLGWWLLAQLPLVTQREGPARQWLWWVEFNWPMADLWRLGVPLSTWVFLLLGTLWTVAVWAFFGGAVTRLAAVQLAADEPLRLRAAVGHARSRFFSYSGAPLLPVLGVLLAAIPVAILGLLLRLDLGVVIAAILWPLALAAGIFMVLLLLGLSFGWPLMWAAVSVESTDAFDALARSYAYVYQRPLHYLFYAIVAFFFGALGWLVVFAFSVGAVHLAAWAASWGSGRELAGALPTLGLNTGWGGLAPLYNWLDPWYVPLRSDRLPTLEHYDSSLARAGIRIMMFWLLLVRLAAVSYIVSYFWTAATAVYLLLRRQVDATELDEVYLDEPAVAQSNLPPVADNGGADIATDEDEAEEQDAEDDDGGAKDEPAGQP